MHGCHSHGRTSGATKLPNAFQSASFGAMTGRGVCHKKSRREPDTGRTAGMTPERKQRGSKRPEREAPLRVQLPVYAAGMFSNSMSDLASIALPLYLATIDPSPITIGLVIGRGISCLFFWRSTAAR